MIKSIWIRGIGCMVAIILINCSGNSQTSKKEKTYRKQLITSIGNAFKDNYVFPETGLKIRDFLLDQYENKVYAPYDNYDSLAKKLKNDIFLIAHDKHVTVSYIKRDSNKTYQQGTKMQDYFNSFEKFGFSNVKILQDNIGYIEIPIFYPPRLNPEASNAAQEAMQKLKNCKAIIFDLRKCSGGSADMLNVLITYLFPEGSTVHLNDFYYRPEDSTSSTYTLSEVPGRRYVDEPVYILTSSKTFSCGEEFCYDLKNLKRAILIGETTGGGAHPVEPRKIDENFEVNLPTGRAINPITKDNWEGKGVSPDIEIEADKALDRALELIKG